MNVASGCEPAQGAEREASDADVGCGRGPVDGVVNSTNATHFGRGSNSGGAVPIFGRLPLLRHSSRLEKGPDENLPSRSVAYHPDLMPRISDLSSLM